MHRLKFRKSWIGLLALVGGAIIMTVIRLNPFSTGTTFDLPFLWVIPAQILLPLFVAFYQYRACPTVQQVAGYLWLCSMICFMGTLGNMFGDPMAIIQQGWLVHFNAVQLSVMNIASIIAAINLMKAEEMSSFADAKVAEAQLGRLKAAKVDPEAQIKWEKAASHAQAQADGRSLRSTMTNLKAISLQDPSQTLTSPASMPKEMPKRPAEPAAEAGSLASLLDRIGDEPAAVAGKDVLEVNEFEPSPAVETIAAKEETAEPAYEPLESNYEFGIAAKLGELDAAAEVAESAKAPVKEQSSGMMGAFKSTSQSTKEPTPVEPLATATSQASPQAAAHAASQPSQVNTAPAAPTSSPSATPGPVDPQSANASSTRLQAMKRRNTSTFTKLQSLSSSTSLKQQPLDTTPQNEPDSLKSLLDRLDDDHVQEPAQPLTPPVELVLDTVFKADGHLEVAAPVVEKAAVEEVKVVSEPAVEDATETTNSTTSSAGHSSISERLTAAPAAEAAAETATETPLTTIPSLANLLDKAEEIQEQEAEVLFACGVDQDIDNLFSDLTPAEAQQEVEKKVEPAPLPFNDPIAALEFPKTVEVDLNPLLSEPLETAQEAEESLSAPVQVEEPEEEEISGSLFDGGLDTDIDNIFSELAPPEAQQEVSRVVEPSKPAEVKEAEVKEAEEDAEESEGALFDGGVDSEIDDIFSNLAPAEALKEVKDVLKPAEAKAAKVAEDEDSEDEGGEEESLFGETLGEDLDNIFSGLTDGQQLEVSPETLAKLKQALPAGEPEAEATTPSPRATGDMPALSVEKAEAIKAEAELEAKTEAKPEVKEEVKEEAKPEAKPASPDKSSPDYKEVKEFGRLSTRSGSLKSAPEAVGTMKTIGKLLLDVKAVENIIKSGETKKIGSGLSTAKIISAARGEGIRNILVAINGYEGVAGSLIVGHDGLVIASTVGTGWDKDMLGALSTALLSTSNLATKKLEIGKLKQMVLLTKLTTDQGDVMKTTVLTDVEVGILAVFLEQTDLTKIDGLLTTIHSTIHGT
jgi:predicted regulator of Ras-like GTPase activity (Roadblock/LC7/MglB family)